MKQLKLPCPVSTCRAENDLRVEVCVHCGTPLREYFRLSAYPSHLFNEGLRAARANRFRRARDLFAAVIHWCPNDRDARNAFAASCLELGDIEEAHRQWKHVLSLFPEDPLAARWLDTIMESKRKSHSLKTPRSKKLARKNA